MSRTHASTLAILPLAILLSASIVEAQTATAAARDHREANGASILATFAELLSIPNVSSDLEGLERNAAWIRGELERRDADVQLWRIEGAAPILFGALDSPGAKRTLGVYVHYDGQPVVPERWRTPGPFHPTLYTAPVEADGMSRPLPAAGEAIDPEWLLYARGSGDDRAPVMAALAALDALAGAGLPRTANLRFLFEGEEEAGSPHLEEYLRAHRDALEGIDGWLICDGPVHQSRRPQLVFGVRGYTGLDLTVYGPIRALHSGHYGNWAPNPALELAHLLASLKSEEGRVLVPGFYDSTLPPGDAERRALEALPAVEDQLRHELGLGHTEGEGASLAERLLLPSLNIRGMESARVGDAARNIIPTSATASLDIRLVAGNDPERMLDRVEDHVRGLGYHVVRDDPELEERLAHPRIVRVDRHPGYRAARTPMDDPFALWVRGVTESVAGDQLVLLPTLGGSLPLYLFDEFLDTPLVVVPIANHDDNQHAPDENLRIANLWYGIDLLSALFAAD